MFKRVSRYGGLLLVVFLALTVSGTVFAGGQEEQGEAEEVTTLRMLYPGTSEIERQWAADLKERVESKYPYELEITYLVWADMEPRLTTMMQAGDYPDLMMTQDVTNLVEMDALQPLNQYFGDDAAFQRDDFIQSALQFSTIDGNIYSMPVLAIGYGLIVNEDLLAEAGYALEDLQTWEDLVDAAEAMTEGDQYGYAFAGGVDRFVWRDALIAGMSNGIDPSDVEREQAYKELLGLYQSLADYMPDAQATWDYPAMFRSFSNDNIGMIANGTYFSANVYSINPAIIGKARAIAFPQGPSASAKAAPISNSGVAMIKGSDNKEAALDVLREIYNPEMSARLAAAINITARTDISAEDIGPHAEEVYSDAIDGHVRVLDDFGSLAEDHGASFPRILGAARMKPTFQKNLLDLIDGDIGVDEAYENLREDIMEVKDEMD